MRSIIVAATTWSLDLRERQFQTPGPDDSSREAITIGRLARRRPLDAWRFHPGHQELQARGGQSYCHEYWVQVGATLREYRFVGTGYDRRPAALFADGSAIRAAK